MVVYCEWVCLVLILLAVTSSSGAADPQLPVEPSAAAVNQGEPAPASPPPVVISPEIASAVAELSADEFAVRQKAEKQLAALGAPAFEALLASLEKIDGEAARRILVILEQIWLQTPQPLADELEYRLDQLSLSQSPYQSDVNQLLQSHYRLREERATRSLRRLNAIVQMGTDENQIELWNNFGIRPRRGAIPTRATTVILPRSWKGTSADLWHIRRLSHIGMLQVMVIRGNGVSRDDLQVLHQGFQELLISERSEVFIGVLGQQINLDNRKGCQVTGVQSDTPAHVAGIEVGNLILAVDGVEISKFDDLVEALKSKRGYQPIELTVERSHGEEPVVITVIGWPWEVRQFERPPRPPESEPLYDHTRIRRERPSLFPDE